MQIEATRKKQADLEAAKVIAAEKEIIDAEVAKKLAEKGIQLPEVTKSSHSPSPATQIIIDAEVDKQITKAASARMTAGENLKFIILLLLGIVGFFVKWWVGLAFIFWAFSYLTKTTNRHKEKILAEGQSKTNFETAYSATLVAVGEQKNEVINVTRAITGLGVNDSRDLVEGLPKTVITGVSKLEAESIHKQFADVGAIVEISPR